MARYLLPCDCGQHVEVDVGQAGGQVVCACGRTLHVPTLRKLRHLPPVRVEVAEAVPAWNARKGLVSLLIVLAAALSAITLWSRLTEPVMPTFDMTVQARYAHGIEQELSALTPLRAWEFWLQLYRPLTQHGFTVLEDPNAPAIRAQIDRRRFLQSAMLIVAGVCVLLAIVVAVVGSRRAPQRERIKVSGTVS